MQRVSGRNKAFTTLVLIRSLQRRGGMHLIGDMWLMRGCMIALRSLLGLGALSELNPAPVEFSLGMLQSYT